MAQKNEPAIIDELYALYEQPLYLEAYKILHDPHLSEDAVQEAFLRLIRNRDKIREPSSRQVRAYVYKTLKSAALDIYRAQKRQRAHCCTLDEAIDCADGENDLSDLSAGLLDALPPRYAAVIRCLFVSGLSVRETAAVLKISEACVRKRCQRARDRLQTMKKEISYEG